ncbi:MAG TPA: trypsin-like serine protease [Streptosporangiaceae bacterium]|nr:trypsin-like serine protease [Streptosporangiaceae bacterium]
MVATVALIMTLVAVTWPMASVSPSVMMPSALVTVLPAARAPAVGALFSTSGGRLGSHFCTASVVDSPAGSLLVTAAHCVAGYPLAASSGLAFVPAYDNGATPYGVWKVTRIFVDSAWASSADPANDVAFLAVARSRGGATIEGVTGGERLGIGQPGTRIVRVTGYPDAQDQPISCQNRTIVFSATQLQFDCDNFTNGTSGSPFLVDVGTAIGAATVIGVIGGYQQGGYTPDISYSAAFGQNVKALYDTAVARS